MHIIIIVGEVLFMQLTWNEDATVLEDVDDIDIEAASWLDDSCSLVLVWKEEEDCMEEEDWKDDFWIWFPKDSLVSSWKVPRGLEEELRLDWDSSEAWLWEKLMLPPFCWMELYFIPSFIDPCC